MKDDGFDEGRRNRDEGQGFLEQRDFWLDSLAILPKVAPLGNRLLIKGFLEQRDFWSDSPAILSKVVLFRKRSKKKNVPHLQGVDRYNRI